MLALAGIPLDVTFRFLDPVDGAPASAVGELVSAFVEAAGDALSVDGISLEIADPSELQRQAREAAYRDAEAKAAQLAELYGVPLAELLQPIDVADPDKAG